MAPKVVELNVACGARVISAFLPGRRPFPWPTSEPRLRPPVSTPHPANPQPHASSLMSTSVRFHHATLGRPFRLEEGAAKAIAIHLVDTSVQGFVYRVPNGPWLKSVVLVGLREPHSPGSDGQPPAADGVFAPHLYVQSVLRSGLLHPGKSMPIEALPKGMYMRSAIWESTGKHDLWVDLLSGQRAPAPPTGEHTVVASSISFGLHALERRLATARGLDPLPYLEEDRALILDAVQSGADLAHTFFSYFYAHWRWAGAAEQASIVEAGRAAGIWSNAGNADADEPIVWLRPGS